MGSIQKANLIYKFIVCIGPFNNHNLLYGSIHLFYVCDNFLVVRQIHPKIHLETIGTDTLCIYQEIHDEKFYKKMGLKHVMGSATPDKFLENPSHMPWFGEKD